MRLTHFSFSSVPSPTARPIPFFILSTQPTKTKQKREHRIPSSLAYFLVTSKRDCCHCHRSLSLSLLNVLFCFFSSYHKTFFFCFFFFPLPANPPPQKTKRLEKKGRNRLLFCVYFWSSEMFVFEKTNLKRATQSCCLSYQK